MDRGRSSYRGRRSRDRDRERRPEYYVGVPPPISMGDLVIREAAETGVVQATTRQEGYVITMIDLALKGHMTMTAMAEGMNAEVMTLISLHMTATDVILNNAPPRKRMNPSQLY